MQEASKPAPQIFPRGNLSLNAWRRPVWVSGTLLALLFVILGVQGFLRPGIALLCFAIIWATAIAAILRHHQKLIATGEALRRLGDQEDLGPVPESAIADAVFRLARQWRRHDVAVKARLAAADMIFDALPDAVLSIGRGRTILRANQTARAWLGDDIAGRPLSVVLRDPALLASIEDILAGKASPEDINLTIGNNRQVSVALQSLDTPRTDDDAALIVTLHDITAIKDTERLRTDFIANVSHELRTPITSLGGFIETLRGPARADPAAQEKFLAIMADQANRLNGLVEDLLSLSRIELREGSEPSGAISIDSVLRRVVDGLLPKAQARDVIIALPPSDPDRPLLRGDEEELVQLFQNLLDNAIKYGGSPGTVTVTIKSTLGPEDRPSLEIAIADQGGGIAPEHLPRLTERFYRIDHARSRDMGGTGLGLAIVKHIVRRHRGQLKINSVLGKGSVFSVILPCHSNAPLSDFTSPDRHMALS